MISLIMAKDIVKKKYPEETVFKIYEYQSCYAFQMFPDGILAGMVGVYKNNGKTFDFKPFYLPINEYRKGRVIYETKQ